MSGWDTDPFAALLVLSSSASEPKDLNSRGPVSAGWRFPSVTFVVVTRDFDAPLILQSGSIVLLLVVLTLKICYFLGLLQLSSH